MSTRKTNSQRILCFSGQFDDATVKEMERYADAHAYRIGNGTLLLCRRKPMGQSIIDRAKSFGWTIQPLPQRVEPPLPIPKVIASTRPPRPTPSRLTQAERNEIARRFVESVNRGDWKKPRKL